MSAYLSIGHKPEQNESSDDDENGIVDSGSMKLDITLESPESALFAVNATSQAVELWPMCAEEGDPVGRVQPDEEVEMILVGQTWCLVACGNVQGYCYTHLLSVVE